MPRGLSLLVLVVGLTLVVGADGARARAEGTPPATATTTSTVTASRFWLEASALPRLARAALKPKLAVAQRRLGFAVSVLVVDRLRHQDIVALGERAFDERGLGAGGGDAVLLVLAPHDRRAAIETGKGNAGIVPEIDARRIVRALTASGLSARTAPARLSRAIDAIVASAEATAQRRRPIPAGEDVPAGAAPTGAAIGGSGGGDEPGAPDAAGRAPIAGGADASANPPDGEAGGDTDAGGPAPAARRTTGPSGRSNVPLVGAIAAIVLIGLALGKRRQLAAERKAKVASERAAKAAAELAAKRKK